MENENIRVTHVKAKYVCSCSKGTIEMNAGGKKIDCNDSDSTRDHTSAKSFKLVYINRHQPPPLFIWGRTSTSICVDRGPPQRRAPTGSPVPAHFNTIAARRWMYTGFVCHINSNHFINKGNSSSWSRCCAVWSQSCRHTHAWQVTVVINYIKQ